MKFLNPSTHLLLELHFATNTITTIDSTTCLSKITYLPKLYNYLLSPRLVTSHTPPLLLHYSQPVHNKMAPSLNTAPESTDNNDHLIKSNDPKHPANLIPELCKKFWGLGWVTGTGMDICHLSPKIKLTNPQEEEQVFATSMSTTQPAETYNTEMRTTTHQFQGPSLPCAIRRAERNDETRRHLRPRNVQATGPQETHLPAFPTNVQTLAMHTTLHGSLHETRRKMLYPLTLPMGRPHHPPPRNPNLPLQLHLQQTLRNQQHRADQSLRSRVPEAGKLGIP